MGSAEVKSTTDETNELQTHMGTSNTTLSVTLLSQLLRVIPGTDEDSIEQQMIKALALQGAFQPSNPLEALLATQMVAVHCLAMKCVGVANIKDQHPEAAAKRLDAANKLFRTFSTQLEALNKLRGKGQQKITVEHISINQGGQAVIGSIDLTKGGHE